MLSSTGLGSLLGAPLRSANRLASVGLALARNRLELFSIELAEERDRAVGLLLWAGAGVACALMALLVGTFAVVYLMPPHWRGYALAGFTGLYLLGALASLLAVKARLSGSKPFERTIGEFLKDHDAL